MVVLSRILEFLNAAGIPVRPGNVPPHTFLPGILVENGTLVFEASRLTWPGDLLHEAGHLAVMRPEQRAAAHSHTGDDAGFEMAAIAWSWAAAIHLDIDPAIVFHSGGYRGGSAAILENFSAGRYFGVPLLEWLQMAASPKSAGELGVPPYPHMLRWLCP